MTQPIRVLLVDDHIVMRAGLRMLIESRPGMQVVGEAGNRADAAALAAGEQPDIVLLDVDLGEDNGLDCLPDILSAARNTRVLMLTGSDDPEIHRRAIQLGALGVVLKDQAADLLVKAIEKVHAGEVWIDRSLMASVLTDMTRAREEKQADLQAVKIASLTDRERQVIALICEGLANKTISQRMSISETTVRHHLTSIFNKLGIESRLELVIYAYKHGLSAPPGPIAPHSGSEVRR